MDPDLLMVVGVTVGVLTVPSLFSAYMDGRAPRAGAIMALIAGVLIAVAVSQRPGGYAIADIPDAFFRVFARYLR
ncbi:MAG TPA: hypothetical protein PKD10_13920 [Paracoccaceae bacterium]|nr:hypothetical protein [Paracoccaceae bacterium]HMO72020.1 hypothetical protein [Paracoccaceae bacterium]